MIEIIRIIDENADLLLFHGDGFKWAKKVVSMSTVDMHRLVYCNEFGYDYSLSAFRSLGTVKYNF